MRDESIGTSPLPRFPLVHITQELLKAYAEASGDHNPIHQDAEVARSMGLPGVIAHGMLVAGRLHQKAIDAHRADLTMTHPGPSIGNSSGVDLKKSRTRFRAMTLLGDALTYSVEKKLTTESAVYELMAFNPKGECVVSATFHF
jgi:acyl dehydratase